MSVTQKELADKLGLSPGAVAFALSDSSQAHKHLHPDTRDRVLAAAKQLNYRPNRLARGLTSGKTGTIGLVVRTLEHPEQSALNQRLVNLIEAGQFDALVTVVPDLADTREIQDLFHCQRPEAIILGPLYDQEPDSFLRQLAAQKFPLVGFQGIASMPFDHVTQDIGAVPTIAANHLVALGHQRIGAVVAFPRPEYDNEIRQVFGERFGRVHVLHESFDFESGLRFASNLRVGPGEPTAWLFHDSCFAAGFIRGASQRGLRIPEDVAFVVHGCCRLSSYLPVSLTNIYADLDELAAQIVRLALERIGGKQTGRPQKIIVPSRLRLGESTVGRAAGQRSEPKAPSGVEGVREQRSETRLSDRTEGKEK